MCIPYKNKSSYPLIYPVTVYPALLLIEKYSIVVDKDRPITIPKFLANEFILPAIPKCFGSTEDIIIELLGDWNKATPIPVRVDRNTIKYIGVFWFKNINKI